MRLENDSHSSTSSEISSPVEFSLSNGLVFQTVMENPSRFRLNETDKLLLQDGRRSMVNYTRYGFLLGATLSPLPLFRGQYAIANLRNLPPLVDRQTKRPNPAVLRARLLWLFQSVVATTLGSGLGTWAGFELGVRSFERKLASMPGSRDRVVRAFAAARREVAGQTGGPGSTDSQELDPVTPFAADDDQDPRPPAGRSRWEELRRAPALQPSTWHSIREKHTKPGLLPAQDPAGPTSADEFEALLDRERELSAGVSSSQQRRV